MNPEHYSLREWPQEDRPREKLLQQGERYLTNAELLAILLRSGTRGKSAVDLARNVLEGFKTLRNMSHARPSDWRGYKGLGPAKIAQIKAALELGRRVGQEEFLESRQQIRSANDAALLLMPLMRDLKKEVFKVIFLNAQNRVLAVEDLEEGTVNHAAPMMREIFERAIHHAATAILCAHNHPAADTRPSREDCVFTQKLVEAGKTLGIKVLDHMIIGGDSFRSLSEEGMMNG